MIYFKFLSPRFITHLDIHLKHTWDLAGVQPPSENIEFWQIKWSVTKITYLKFSSFLITTISIYLLVPSSLVNYHCQSPYFSTKSEYQNSSACNVFFKTLSASKCYFSKNCVALLPWLRPFYLTLWLEKQLCNGETYKKYEKRAFAVQISTLCVSKLEVFTQLPPACNENSWTSMASCRDFL